MRLPLNSIFHLSQAEIENSKIELNLKAGAGGTPFIEKWLLLTRAEKDGGVTECSYWGWYGGKRNFTVGQTVFSFIRMKPDTWLFISAGEITDMPPGRAKVNILGEYAPLFGRLVMSYAKGKTYSRYVFRMQSVLDGCTVVELLPQPYGGEKFEGYDRVHLRYGLLEKIFHGELMPEFHAALGAVTGVYCLTDQNTGKLYIGSATGEGGVAQRWGNYLDSKHGGNKKLLALYREKGGAYFEAHFTYTLIEYFGLSYDPEKVKAREQYWKKCFDTIKHGYNDN